MLGFAWITLRQAEEALRAGRLEEAQRLLSHPAVQGRKRSSELHRQVARGYAERGDRRLRNFDSEAAWGDLLQAEQLGGADGEADNLRQALVKRELGRLWDALHAGEPDRAAELAGRLADRPARHTELDLLQEAARGWCQARDKVQRGEFAQALETLARSCRMLAGSAALERFRDEVKQKQLDLAATLLKLHEALEQGRWTEVLALAQEVLEVAPQHRDARKARDLAWKSVQPGADEPVADGPLEALPAEMPRRFLLWLDGVGGFLVCLAERVTLGQAGADATADVPLFADVSRQHAVLTRDAEGYVIEAPRGVQVNGQETRKTLLRHSDRVTLGSGCELRFRQPSPVSASARLDPVTGHRLPVGLDAVLLMADTLVLGPGAQAHVTLMGVRQTVVLFRDKDGLGVRCPGHLTVNGQPADERAFLGPTATVAGDDFAFALEPVGTKLGRG
jgi:FHA domain